MRTSGRCERRFVYKAVKRNEVRRNRNCGSELLLHLLVPLSLLWRLLVTHWNASQTSSLHLLIFSRHSLTNVFILFHTFSVLSWPRITQHNATQNTALFVAHLSFPYTQTAVFLYLQEALLSKALGFGTKPKVAPFYSPISVVLPSFLSVLTTCYYYYLLRSGNTTLLTTSFMVQETLAGSDMLKINAYVCRG